MDSPTPTGMTQAHMEASAATTVAAVTVATEAVIDPATRGCVGLLRVFATLSAFSTLFLLESSLEVYGLTFFTGQQMLFFSLAHTGGTIFIAAWEISGVCLVFATATGIVMALVQSSTAYLASISHTAFSYITAAFALHLVLLGSYDYWSTGALSREICLMAVLGGAWLLHRGIRALRPILSVEG